MNKFLNSITHLWHVIFLRFTAWKPSRPNKPRRRWDRQLARDAEEEGRWYYLRDILDRLDEYFHFVRWIRRCDPVAYHLHTKIGGLIGSERGLFTMKELPAAWRHGHTEAFGMVMMLPGGGDKGTIYPAFAYFIKMRGGHNYTSPLSDTFDVGIQYFDREKGEKWGYPVKYRVSVNKAGEVTVLKRCRLRSHPLPTNSYISVPCKSWEYPNGLLSVWAEHSRRDRQPFPGRADSVQEFGSCFFRWIVQSTHQASAGFLVRAKKDGVVAAFAVDMLRTPYFFKDRDVTVNEKGQKQKIFHIVRTHERVYQTGRKGYVRSHFRGLRRFQWNGYDVTVTMPGFHHKDTKDFTASATEFEADEKLPKGTIDIRQVAKRIGEHLDAA